MVEGHNAPPPLQSGSVAGGVGEGGGLQIALIVVCAQQPPELSCPVCITMGIKAALPKYEIYFYNVVLCLAMFWAASWIFEVSSCEYEEEHVQYSHTVEEGLLIHLQINQT